MGRTDRFWFSVKRADKAQRFIESFCRHIKGEWAGEHIKLADWQRDEIVRPAFGWVEACSASCSRDDKCTNFHPRKYRQVYVEIPRGNGKSTICGAIGLLLTVGDDEPGAVVYSAAGDRDQAREVFDVAKGMVLDDPSLNSRCEVYRDSIVFPSNRSRYKVISADAATKHGANLHGVIFDELHTQPNRDLFDVLHTSTGKRRQPLEFMITTAGSDKHSICYEMHEYAQRVLSGAVDDPRFLAVIYAADEGDDWTDPAVWEKANPNLGISPKRDFVEDDCRKAQELASYENTFKRLQLNIWTEQHTRWIQMAAWQSCDAPVDTAGHCVAGVDLASVSDLTAVEVYWPDTHSVESHFFVPEEGIVKRAKRDGVPYDAWARDGFLEATPGNRTDFGYVRKRLNELRDKYGLRDIFIDRYNASHLVNELQEDGFNVVDVACTMNNVSAPAKQLEKLVAEGKLRHGGHPVLTWNASNVTVRIDADGNIRPDKAKSGEKIDGIVALVLAILGAKSVRPMRPSRWEQEGAELLWV